MKFLFFIVIALIINVFVLSRHMRRKKKKKGSYLGDDCGWIDGGCPFPLECATSKHEKDGKKRCRSVEKGTCYANNNCLDGYACVLSNWDKDMYGNKRGKCVSSPYS